ncbi:hypothetical protein [Citrobacter sp. BDA59-3]|uniref:hypothetical protein n=1 Tax=Citrobacter sp. BDA59-3 TaxID=2781952 RepID=UPI001881ACFC|nr:hypothetical protein [Citrobacter sp. BDA59-3]QOV68205.1 hypothetical protein IP582_21690 [Citrobacter sp. BDA59-3]
MNVLATYGKEIFSLLVPVFTLIINKFFKNNAKVVYGELHQFTFLVNEKFIDGNGDEALEKKVVHTQSYIIVNEGREPATNLEIIFNYAPQQLNIWPVRPYTQKLNDDGRYIMVFDFLATNELTRCEIMSINEQLPELLSVRSKEGMAKMVGLIPQKVLNPLFIKFMGLLVFIGAATLVYFIVIVLQWLLLKTG